VAGGRLNLAKALFGGLTLATQSRNIHKVLQQFQRTVGAYHSGLRLAEIVQPLYQPGGGVGKQIEWPRM
jgi:hypothetical protein